MSCGVFFFWGGGEKTNNTTRLKSNRLILCRKAPKKRKDGLSLLMPGKLKSQPSASRSFSSIHSNTFDLEGNIRKTKKQTYTQRYGQLLIHTMLLSTWGIKVLRYMKCKTMSIMKTTWRSPSLT